MAALQLTLTLCPNSKSFKYGLSSCAWACNVKVISGRRHAGREGGRSFESSERVGGCGVRAQGPPKQGRGLKSRKASVDGIRQRKLKEDFEKFEGWQQVSKVEELTDRKNKAIIHKDSGYLLTKVDESVYVIYANCSCCKFPMINGTISAGEGEEAAPRIECPLCHSKYSLSDGKVVQFCPKDGPVQWLVGTIKQNETQAKARFSPRWVAWVPSHGIHMSAGPSPRLHRNDEAQILLASSDFTQPVRGSPRS